MGWLRRKSTDSTLAFMSLCYRTDEIRAAEQPYLSAQSRPDELMTHAAAAVAEIVVKRWPEPMAVLTLVGSGGNGGDALYASRDLLQQGYPVDAVIVGAKPHQRALAAFVAAGGRIVSAENDEVLAKLGGGSYQLLIDGIVGLGGQGALRDSEGRLCYLAQQSHIPVVAIDVPSGVDADSGQAGRGAPGRAGHVQATVTVTFGGLRWAHALSSACGEVLLRDIHLDTPTAELPGLGATLRQRYRDPVHFRHALAPVADLEPMSLEPGPQDHKYSGGVTGIVAGSEQYPGAGVLCTSAAVAATSAAVMVVGPGPVRARATAACPTVIGQAYLARTRADAWVVGPGIGLEEQATADLTEVLRSDLPAVVDADALTLLAQHPQLQELVRHRRARTLLTPHFGEFERLRGHPVGNPIADARELAAALHCEVLLKGRRTVIVSGGRTTVVDTGSSWAATPGSGDVLAGVLGAWLARDGDMVHPVIIHSRASYLAAATDFGPAPCSASDIAAQLRRATAWFLTETNNGTISL